MTVDTMSENISLSKWFLTSKAPYSKPCVRLPSFPEKNIDQVVSELCFLEPHSSIFCIINSDHKSSVKNYRDIIINTFNQLEHHPMISPKMQNYIKI